jgi:hypothetical protein
MTTIYHYTTWDKAQEILKSGIITGNLAHREQIRVFGNVTWFTANQYERTGYHMRDSSGLMSFSHKHLPHRANLLTQP